MTFSPELAAIRFGTGLSPTIAAPSSVDAMIGRLKSADTIADDYPIPPYETVRVDLIEINRLSKLRRKSMKAGDVKAAQEYGKTIRGFRSRGRANQSLWLRQAVLRGAMTDDGFRERLTYFWADHFTARGNQGVMKFSGAAYVSESIRPHISGRFVDLLKAVVVSPLMILYLNQRESVGPNSSFGKRNKKRGLNENFARELLELHTLGVDGPYGQNDVTEFAELLTGLSYQHDRGFYFDPKRAEPGAETVMGVSYGPNQKDGLDPIMHAMEDLAAHPETAKHLAQKLATHFVSDTPDADLIEAMAKAYMDNDGDLSAVYRAMLDHPASWSPDLINVKWPFDYVVSAMRALDVPQKRYMGWKWKDAYRWLGAPLAVMGQAWEQPVGPDGWPEEDEEWITPVGIAGRIQWAMVVPQRIKKPLPDPRDFLEAALGDFAPQSLKFAVSAAETQAEGIGLVLSSPAFQRR